MQHGQMGVGRGEWLGGACGTHERWPPTGSIAGVVEHAVEDVARSRLENLLPATKDVGVLGTLKSELYAFSFEIELLESGAVYRQQD